MRSHNLGCLILLIATITACSSSSVTERLTEEMKTVTSWVATARMVGEAWLEEDVPTAYAKRTLASATESLQQETETIAKVAPTQQRPAIVERLQQLQQGIRKMGAAVEQQDKSSLVKQMQTLSTQEKSLQSFIKQIGTPP